MRNTLIRIAYGIVLFFAAVIVMEMLTRQEPAEVTSEMAGAVLPVVTMNVDGTEVNELHGFVTERDISHFRTVCTPVYEDREMAFTVDTYGAEVTSLSFAVRSVDGTRLVENNPVEYFTETAKDTISASFTLKDLLEKDREYMLILTLTTGGRDVYYYTRIKETDSSTFETAAEFAERFHKGAISGTERDMIRNALETKSSSDSFSYSYVDINDSYERVTYGELSPFELLSPVISVRDLQNETAVLKLDYILSVYVNGVPENFRCTERFRVRVADDTCYLLDYRRTMDQEFDPSNENNYVDGIITLGLSRNADLRESEAGSAFAFTQAGDLYGCIPGEGEISTVFSFADSDSLDRREVFRDNDIRILNVDETGEIIFLVYGYFNRGDHEGEIGIDVLSYNREYRTVEECAFLPYSGSYEILRPQMETLSYYNKAGELYLLIDETVYRVDLAARKISTAAVNLTEGGWQASDSGQMAAWKSASVDNGDDRDELTLLDFSTGSEKTVAAESGERIFSLGFIGEDFIYGLARSSDVTKTTVGDALYPMYRIVIADSGLNVLAEYEKSGFYVTSVSVEDNQIRLTRLERDPENGGFMDAPEDSILASSKDDSGKNTLSSRSDTVFGTVTLISARGLYGKTVTSVTAKTEENQGDRVIVIPADQEEKERFFVYDIEGAVGFYGKLSLAVSRAEELRGCVVDEHNTYMWVAANRQERNQIMAISGTLASEGESTVAACLSAVASFEGVGMDPQAELDSGKTVIEILDSSIAGCRAYDLSGCSLDAVLYYVNREKPVLALSEGGSEGQLIVGYNSEIVVMMDPASGELIRTPREEIEAEYAQSGAGYICYLTEND